MKIKIDGVVKDISKDIHNKGRYRVAIELEEDFGNIILYNVEAKDYADINLYDEVELELNTFCINMVIDNSYNIHIKRKCIVYIDDRYFDCCVLAPSINATID